MNKITKILIALLLIALASAGAYFFITKRESAIRPVNFSQTWRLVPEKISKSAPIKIFLPEGFTKEQLTKTVTFDPQIKGQWVSEKTGFNIVAIAYGQNAEPQADFALFQPSQALAENLHYAVIVDLGAGKSMKADFLVAEDPKIDAIFPKDEMEAPEDSKITIAFNRPMVALTTLDEMEKNLAGLPIEITPKPEGRWKWISTNTLQFIPKTALQRSSDYYVSVKKGLNSLDGLPVAPVRAHFKTRSLRYLNAENKQIDEVVYNQPLKIYFNQPVDLKRTVEQTKITDSAGKEISFVADYAKTDKSSKSSYLQTKDAGFFAAANDLLAKLTAKISDVVGGSDSNLDKSIIEIFAKKDGFGRQKFWDISTNYKITIGKAFPLEGNINIENAQVYDFRTTDLIRGWDEANARSNYADLKMFDPEGQLKISFYEDIDIARSSFEASAPITQKSYGQKCKDAEFSVGQPGCETVDDKKTVLINFDKQKVSPGQTINIKINKLVSGSGVTINGRPVENNIAVYQPLEYRIGKFTLSNITLCSNTPLSAPDRKDLRSHVQANLDFEIFSWGSSWRRESIYNKEDAPCNIGEFETNISIGLMPTSEYKLFFNADDLFGQNAKREFDIATGQMDSQDTEIFRMQQQTSVAVPDQRVLTYAAKNLTYVSVSICKLSALAFYNEKQRLNDYQKEQLDPEARNCTEEQSRKIELPERYWINNYFDIDPAQDFEQPLGFYIVTLSHPQFLDYKKRPERVRSFVTVTNLAAAQKVIDPQSRYNDAESSLSDEQLRQLQNLYWINDIKTLAPVANATVKIYRSGQVAGTATTNEKGVALINPAPGVDLTTVESNDDATIISGYESEMNWASSAYNVKRGYIYFDRPIYRPGDKVNIRGILRLGYDGNYQMLDNEEIGLEIQDPRWNKIATPTVKLNEYGAFTAEFNIDKEGALGTYRVCAANNYGCGNFDVKEYAPAAFKVDTKAAKDEFVSKENAKIDIAASYYFGVPVANGTAEYTVSAQNYYFDKYREGGYSFGFYDECVGRYCYGDRFITRGKLDLDSQGKGSINQQIDLQKIAGSSGFANSRIIVFDISVTNSMGQSVSAQKSIIVHAGDFYIGAKADPSFTGKLQNINLAAKTVDIAGKPVQAGNLRASVYRVDWVYAKRLEAGGNYNYDWTEKRDLVKTIDLSRSGTDYSAKMSLDKEGEYEIDFSGNDKRGNAIMSRENVYIYGENVASIRPSNDTSLTIKTPQSALDAGQEGQIIIESPFKTAKALIAIERGKIFDYKIVDVTGSLYNYAFKTADEYAPNVFVSVLLQSSDPAVKFGSQEFQIDSAAKKISVDVISDKKTYQPGEKVTLDIRAKDSAGRGVAAEFSVAVADVSVLALAGNPKKDPYIFFYDGLPLTVNTSSNVKNILVKVDKGALSKGGSGGGGEGDEKVRGDFRDTALWKGSVATDSNGNARIEFFLPDNLTTWQAEAVGVSKDTKLGAGYAEFISQKDLMVVPLKPRFIIPGDDFYIGSQVFNQSNAAQNVKTEFLSDTLQFVGKDKSYTINLKPQETKTVYFNVKAPFDQTKGIHSFTIKASGNGVSDAVRLSIPVRPNLTYESVATANYITGNAASEVIYLPANVSKEQGGVTVKSSATLAVFLSNALNYLIGYPYGCTEQISSRLKAMAVVKAGLNVPNLADKFQLKTVWDNGREYKVDELISIGLTRVYNNQANDGGFGMWDGGKSDFYATLQAVEMLQAMKRAKIEINELALIKAQNYLAVEFNRNNKVNDRWPDRVIAVAQALADNPQASAGVKSEVMKIAQDSGLLADKLSNKTLASLSIVLGSGGYSQSLKKNVDSLLDNRITIDSRGAFLQAGEKNQYYDYFETTAADTALYLDSLALAKRDSKFSDRVIRWILNSRDKDGAWGSTQNTLAAAKAFTDWLNWKQETTANFELAIKFNGQQISDKTFNAQSILDQSSVDVTAKEFAVGKNNILEFAKKESSPLKQNAFYYDIGLKYYLSGIVVPRDEGFSVSRAFYRVDDAKGQTPLGQAAAGDILRAHLEITVPRDRRFVAVEDYIPAGMEIVDLDLATEQKSLRFNEPEVKNDILPIDYKELRDDRAFFYVGNLAAGTYEFDYYVRALAKGKYLQLPGVVSEFYNPENFGRTASNYFEVK